MLNRDEPKSTEIAKIMINEFPGLALDFYEGDEMCGKFKKTKISSDSKNLLLKRSGQSSLHIAIVHDDYDTVCLLIDKGCNVNQRATGRFFLPDDQKTIPPKKQSNYAGKKKRLNSFFIF